MALINCPECGTQVSDRAPTCPKCGVPIAAQTIPAGAQVMPVEPTKASPPSGEVTYYTDQQGVRVTNARAIMGNRTYSMANISSVHLWKQDPSNTGPVILILFGVLQGVCCLAIKDIRSVSILGLILLAIGIAWLVGLKPTYYVRITAAGGETNALGSQNYAYIKGVVDALNEAIVKRG